MHSHCMALTAPSTTAAEVSSKGELRLPREVNGTYRLGKKLGQGSFGVVYSCKHHETGEVYAVKLEGADNRRPMLMFEAKLLQYLHAGSNVDTVPMVHFVGTEGPWNMLVMDLLGLSLEDIGRRNQGNLSLKSVLMLGIQMIQRVQFLHSKYFLHRDLKPGNFLVGRGDRASTLYLIDFGLAKKYYDPKAKEHIPYCEGKRITGTARFASINSHLGIESSRRDDLEALSYVLLYLLIAPLPWQQQQAPNAQELSQKIVKHKMSIRIEDLCVGLPNCFEKLLRHSRALQFEEEPDYEALIKLFEKELDKGAEAGDFDNDGSFEWEPASRAASRSSVRSPPRMSRPTSSASIVSMQSYRSAPSISTDMAVAATASIQAGSGSLDDQKTSSVWSSLRRGVLARCCARGRSNDTTTGTSPIPPQAQV